MTIRCKANERKRKTNTRTTSLINDPISSHTDFSHRHPSHLSTLSANLSRIQGPRNPTPAPVIQSASGFSHFDFPSSWLTDFGRCPFRPFSSRRSNISFLAFSNFRCMHLRNTWMRDILHCSHYSNASDTGSSRICLVRFGYGPERQCPVRIWEIVLPSLFEARSKKDFFGTGGKMKALPFWVSSSLAVL
jgi:hypothetical protein